ncbi:Late transcription factor VLTF-4 (1), partial [Monkeypox virus]
MAWSITNKADT